ncbi:MAG TPA: hypothetical protein VGL70_09825 [Candidatus Binatia bacterium]|jgi:hypothetical protein
MLTAGWHDCLLHHVRKDTKAEAVLHGAADLSRHLPTGDRRFSIDCDEGIADEILRVAIAHCPDAVSEIEMAIRLARQ